MKTDTIKVVISTQRNGISWKRIFRKFQDDFSGGFFLLRYQELEFTPGRSGELNGPV